MRRDFFNHQEVNVLQLHSPRLLTLKQNLTLWFAILWDLKMPMYQLTPVLLTKEMPWFLILPGVLQQQVAWFLTQCPEKEPIHSTHHITAEYWSNHTPLNKWISAWCIHKCKVCFITILVVLAKVTHNGKRRRKYQLQLTIMADLRRMILWRIWEKLGALRNTEQLLVSPRMEDQSTVHSTTMVKSIKTVMLMCAMDFKLMVNTLTFLHSSILISWDVMVQETIHHSLKDAQICHECVESKELLLLTFKHLLQLWQLPL